MTSQIIAIIGAGHMGGSLARGLIKQGLEAKKLWIADPGTEKRHHLEQQYAVNTTSDNAEAVKHAEIVIFAVKPQVFREVLQTVRDIIRVKKPIVISIATGIKTAYLQQELGEQVPIIRAMPNLAASILQSATAFYATPAVSETAYQQAEVVLRSVGIVVPLHDESLLNVVTAISGSGPAYFFYIMECLEQAAIEMGLTQEEARHLVLQTALGAAKMASAGEHAPEALREQVTSKGGTTEAAIGVLKTNHLQDMIKKTCLAARQRAEELARS